MSLAAKLAEVSSECGRVAKDSKNAYHKYSYASAEAVLRKVNVALTSRSIAIASKVALVHFEPGHAVVHIQLTFLDGDSDERITVEGLGEGSDTGDKAVMKANTAALKYAYANALTISWGDDPEADSATDEVSEVDVGDLLTSIASAGSLGVLRRLRSSVVACKGRDGYKELVSTYKSREEELRNE